LFFATEHSAYIASVLTSLIATCLHAGVNALEYLVALQEHRSEVFAAPEAWLPWMHLLTSLWTHMGRNSFPPLIRPYLIYVMCLQKEF
jgi:hypothetical protein